MGTAVGIQSPRTVALVEEDEPPLGATQVRLRTLYSGISAGTELTAYRGTSPYLDRLWRDDQRLFVPGTPTYGYPMVGLGYEEVGEVAEVGTGVTRLQVGDRVWGTWGHRSLTVQDEEYAAARTLGTGSDPRLGTVSHIGAVALNLVLDADIHIGETVAVFGLGVPGQLAAQLARLNGARVIAVDAIEARRELAGTLGADEVLDPLDGDVAVRIKELTGGRGADVCLEITGNYAALHEAARSVAYNSRVCVGGFFQGGGTDLRLGEEFHHNRVQVVSTQISGVAPALQHRWDRYRLASTAVRLAESGRLRVLDLVTHTFGIDRVAEAFTLVDEHPRDVLQVLLSFDGAEA